MGTQGTRDKTVGALDAFVHAVIGDRAGRPRPAPRATPENIARTFGEGLVRTLQARENDARAPRIGAPIRTTEIAHEGQRSTVELSTLLWHAMDGPREAPDLATQLPALHADPIIALSIGRSRRAEYAVTDRFGRTCAFPGKALWLIEIEHAKGDVPNAVALWRSPDATGGWETRCACLWTKRRDEAAASVLLIGARWRPDGADATGAACRLGPAVDGESPMNAKKRKRQIERRREAIGPEMIARIAAPAALAWLDQHEGEIRPGGRIGIDAGQSAPERRIVHTVPAPAKTTPPAWMTTTPARAAEAIVVRAAGEGWRIGGSCAVGAWREGWAGRAELGAIAWHALGNPDKAVDAQRWRAIEAEAAAGALDEDSAHPALAATSALVRKMLTQIGREHVAGAPDERTLCAIEIPARLWRALAAAGACPDGPAKVDLDDRWWFVEIERPGDDEPNAIALWKHEDGSETTLTAFLAPDGRTGATWPTIVSWRTRPSAERTHGGVAVLAFPMRVDDPKSPQSQAGAKTVIDAMTAPDTGPIARAKTAIALHLATDGRATPLGRYHPSGRHTRAGSATAPAADTRTPTLFALERAPEPEPAEAHARGDEQHGSDGGRLRTRHHVRAHWKRQAFGPQLARRRWIVVEGYARGPTPREDQIVMTRIAEGTGASTQ